MDAVVTAGGISAPDNPLYHLTGIEKKALIPLAGKPMISWVVEALYGSALIEHIVIVGLEPHQVAFKDIPVHFTKPRGDLIDNILAGRDKTLEINPAAQKILLASSDIPLITPAIVRGFIEECGSQQADVYYAVVEEKTMNARFPNSNRMFVPLKNGRYSGGDLFLSHIDAPAKANLELLRALTQSRKNYWQQARMLGFRFIIRFLLGLMSLEEAARRGSKLLNVEAKGVDTRFAELAMDLDKPHHYEIIKAALEEQQAKSSPQPGVPL